MSKTPMLDKIEKAQVFDVELSDDKKTLTISEICDYYYDIQLNALDVANLAMELINIAKNMEL